MNLGDKNNPTKMATANINEKAGNFSEPSWRFHYYVR